MRKRFPLLLGLLALASCTQTRREAEKTLAQIGPGPLREVAAKIHKDLFAGYGPGYYILKDVQWPAQFSAFHPHHVSAYLDGFAIALSSEHDMETGIYVVPAHCDLQPRPTKHRRYERLVDGVYWYSFDL